MRDQFCRQCRHNLPAVNFQLLVQNDALPKMGGDFVKFSLYNSFSTIAEKVVFNEKYVWSKREPAGKSRRGGTKIPGLYSIYKYNFNWKDDNAGKSDRREEGRRCQVNYFSTVEFILRRPAISLGRKGQAKFISQYFSNIPLGVPSYGSCLR